jgi:hypothetical protein
VGFEPHWPVMLIVIGNGRLVIRLPGTWIRGLLGVLPKNDNLISGGLKGTGSRQGGRSPGVCEVVLHVCWAALHEKKRKGIKTRTGEGSIRRHHVNVLVSDDWGSVERPSRGRASGCATLCGVVYARQGQHLEIRLRTYGASRSVSGAIPQVMLGITRFSRCRSYTGRDVEFRVLLGFG